MCCFQSVLALWAAKNAQELDVLHAHILQILNGCDCRAACCEHRINHNNFPFLNIIRHLRIILYSVMCTRFTENPDVTDFCSRNQRGYTLNQSQTSPQNRYKCQLLTRNDLGFRPALWGFQLYGLERQIPHCFIANQHCRFFCQFPKFLYASALIPHQRKFVLHQRMCYNV